jgi:hypothetical protein
VLDAEAAVIDLDDPYPRRPRDISHWREQSLQLGRRHLVRRLHVYLALRFLD